MGFLPQQNWWEGMYPSPQPSNRVGAAPATGRGGKSHKKGIMNLFITGTDTDIGKTFVTAGLALTAQVLGYRVGVYKPFQSGAVEINGELKAPDLEFIEKLEGDNLMNPSPQPSPARGEGAHIPSENVGWARQPTNKANIKTAVSYIMKAPTSPALAAELENVDVNMDKILADYKKLKAACDITFVEGAGGICVPLAKALLVGNLIKLLNLPIIIVARPDLGTVNHTLLTIHYAKSQGIEIKGIIINKYPENTSDIAVKNVVKQIESYTDAKILGVIKDIESKSEITKENMVKIFSEHIDIKELITSQNI